MKTILFTSIAAGSLFFTSCGDKKKVVDTGISKDGLAANEAVENWRNDTAEGRLASLWDSLPSEYQTDVSGIVHSFGEKIDGEVYNETMKTVSSVAKLLKDKKSLILEMAKEQAPDSQKEMLETLEGNYDAVVGLFNAISSSDAKDVDGLKKLDMAKFLSGIQAYTKELSELASLAPGGKENMAKLRSATAKLLSESGDSAEVEVTAGDDTETMKLIKKDGRWLPVEMVRGWKETMKDAHDGLRDVSDMQPMQKEKMMDMLGMVQNAIKQLERADTKEEVMQKLPGIVIPFMSGM